MKTIFFCWKKIYIRNWTNNKRYVNIWKNYKEKLRFWIIFWKELWCLSGNPSTVRNRNTDQGFLKKLGSHDFLDNGPLETFLTNLRPLTIFSKK